MIGLRLQGALRLPVCSSEPSERSKLLTPFACLLRIIAGDEGSPLISHLSSLIHYQRHTCHQAALEYYLLPLPLQRWTL